MSRQPTVESDGHGHGNYSTNQAIAGLLCNAVTSRRCFPSFHHLLQFLQLSSYSILLCFICVTPVSRTVRAGPADSPPGIARYLSGWVWDPLVISLFLLTPSRAKRSPSAHAVVAPSVDLPPPATKPRFLARVPSSAPPPPSQTLRPASYGRNRPPPPPVAIGGA